MTVLAPTGNEGTWSVTLSLHPGVYKYAFLVDGRLKPAVDAPRTSGDEFGIASSVIDLSSPEYATSVGLLLWRLRQGSVQRVAPAPPNSPFLERVMKWLRALLP